MGHGPPRNGGVGSSMKGDSEGSGEERGREERIFFF